MGEVSPEEPSGVTTGSFTFAQWFRGWRYFFWFLAAVLLVVLCFTEEDWRGHWAWTRQQREMKARGEPISAKDFIPPRVPEEENLAMTPLLDKAFRVRSLRTHKALTAALSLTSEYDPSLKGARSQATSTLNTWAGPPAGLTIWQAVLLKATNQTILPRDRLVATNFTIAEAAEATLAALEDCEPVFAELQSVSQRPYSRFDITYEQADKASILLPHLAVVKQLSQLALLRASAELALHRTDAAFADLELMFRLADATQCEPIFVSQLVRADQILSAMQPIASGMSQWSEAQLRALQEQLGRFDLCADGSRVLRSERSFFGDSLIQYVRRSENKLYTFSMLSSGANNGPGGLEIAGLLMVAAPDGWFDFEHVNLSRTYEDYLLPIIDASNRLVRPGASRRAETHMSNLLSHTAPGLFLRHRLFCGLMIPSVPKIAEKIAFAQTAIDTAGLACVLERYRHRNNQYPDSLSQLIPEFIARFPHDIINGQPLKYVQTSDGSYVLYSVGWNETDEGGTVVRLKGGEVDRQSGDWVWRPTAW